MGEGGKENDGGELGGGGGRGESTEKGSLVGGEERVCAFRCFPQEPTPKPHMFCLSASGAPPHSRALPLRLSTRIRNTATDWAMASVKTASSPVCWARMAESARHFSDVSSTRDA